MIKLNEYDVLLETQKETERFLEKLKTLIQEVKNNNSYCGRSRSAVKRSGIDLKNQISKITTSVGTSGIYYLNE